MGEASKNHTKNRMFQDLRDKGFEVHALHHAEAIIVHDMEDAIVDISRVLGGIELPVEELVRGGGGEGQLTQRLRYSFENAGWAKHNFEIKKIVDGMEKEATEVDPKNWTAC